MTKPTAPSEIKPLVQMTSAPGSELLALDDGSFLAALVHSRMSEAGKTVKQILGQIVDADGFIKPGHKPFLIAEENARSAVFAGAARMDDGRIAAAWTASEKGSAPVLKACALDLHGETVSPVVTVELADASSKPAIARAVEALAAVFVAEGALSHASYAPSANGFAAAMESAASPGSAATDAGSSETLAVAGTTTATDDGGFGTMAVNFVIHGTSEADLMDYRNQPPPSGFQWQLEGHEGDDTIYGSNAGDIVSGDSGNDTLIGMGGSDTFYGADGFDTLDYSQEDPATVFQLLFNMSIGYNISWSGGTIVVHDNEVRAGAGNIDVIAADFGSIEKVIGTRDAGDGVVTRDIFLLKESNQAWEIWGLEGADRFYGGFQGDTLIGGAHADKIFGAGGADRLYANIAGSSWDSGAIDTLIGGSGNDYLEGSSEDILIGGTGNDTFEGGHVVYTNVQYSLGFSISAGGSAGDEPAVASADVVADRIVDLGAGTVTGGGEVDTLRNVTHVSSGEGNDRLISGNSGSWLEGDAGNDTLYGGGGSDKLHGGSGYDIFYGSGGNDTVDGGSEGGLIDYSDATYNIDADLITGRIRKGTIGLDNVSGLWHVTGTNFGDRLIGNSQGNQLLGNDGDDTIDGGAGGDWLAGGAGNDSIYGGGAIEHDVLVGGVGDDTVNGGGGADDMYEDLGDDHYWIDNAGDRIILDNGVDPAASGVDTVHTTISLDLSTLPFIEHAKAETGAGISLTGNGLHNILWGNSGNDTLKGGTGNDTIWGGGGNDTIYEGSGDDTYWIDNPGDTIIADTDASGVDTVLATTSYTLADFIEHANVARDDGIGLALTGNGLGNRLTGNIGDDTLDGGAGVDTMTGGLGHDTYIIDDRNDYAIEQNTTAEGSDTAIIRVRNYDIRKLANIENIIYEGEGSPNVVVTRPDLQGAAFINENTTDPNQVAATVKSTDDGNGGPIEYRLVDSLNGLFSIATVDSNGEKIGEIRLNRPVDFEALTASTPGVVIDDQTGAKYFRLQVYAQETDVADGGLTSDVSEILVEIGNVNEAPTMPYWAVNGSTTLPEPIQENGEFSFAVQAEDVDGTMPLYEFDPDRGAEADANGLFVIDRNTGVISLAQGRTLDFESSGGVYRIYVRSTDGSLNSAVQELTINVSDVDDQPTAPTWQSNRTAVITVNENEAFSAAVTSVDDDGPGPVTYRFDPDRSDGTANANGLFAIDTNTGLITATRPLDFETAPVGGVYKIYVQAVSGSGPGAVQELTINVTNVNEAPSAPNVEIAGGAIGENTTGQQIALFSDSWDPEQQGITYAFHEDVPQALRDKFTLSTNPDGSGELTLTDPSGLDYEGATDDGNGNRYYLLKVVSRDIEGLDSEPVEIRVYVNDVNEAPTAVVVGELARVRLGAQQGDLIVDADVIDPDTNPAFQNNVFKFLLSDGSLGTTSDDGFFTIDADGKVRLAADVTADQVGTEHRFTIVAHVDGDENQRVSSQEHLVTVQGDDPPVMTSQDIFNVPENTGQNWSIGDPLSAADPDGDPITGFDLVDTNVPFSIEQIGSDWFLVVSGPLDYETAPHRDEGTGERWYEVQVTATAGDLTSEPQTIRVYISDVDPENTAPVITVAPNGRLDWTVGDDAAVDPFQHLSFYDEEDGQEDDNPNTFVKVEIFFEVGQGEFDQPDMGNFPRATFDYTPGSNLVTVTGTAGEVTAIVQGLTFHARSRPDDPDGTSEVTHFFVILSDTGNASTIQEVTVDSIAGDGGNNQAPTDIRLDGGVVDTVAENLLVGDVVGDLTATDEHPSALTYSFVTGFDGAGHFEIDNTTKQIKVLTALDYEAPIVDLPGTGLEEDQDGKFYRLRVVATDGANQASPEQEIKVYVTNVNEAPTLQMMTGGVIAETLDEGSEVAELLAEDPEGDAISFTFANGTLISDDSAFRIEGNKIVVNNSQAIQVGPGGEERDYYQIIVSDQNGASPPTNITIRIDDVPSGNQEPGDIVFQGGVVSVLEHLGTGLTIGFLQDTDADGDQLTYTLLTDGGGRIDLRNGNEIVVKDHTKIDFEQMSTPEFSFTVQVDDGQGHVVERTITLGVENRLLERVNGTANADYIKTGSRNDQINGGGGDDTLSGGLGRDQLSGGTGSDVFLFDTRLSTTNWDLIDFNLAHNDRIWLKQSVFTALGTGSINQPLASSAFALLDGTITDQTRIIYDQTTGDIFYDANGSGTGQRVKFAEIAGTTPPTISAEHFFVV
ncbi:cadherin domain-containing protein [Microvirga makkahensis]|uniref:Cadherin domain-containing protein n=1 Tax=Microvirga makkahensis TaxID=1128670 RepID=A0A7X3SN59_9HYPH|nr:cadherin domain-containing protein [Microvirga makkahensis]MXQ10940.1 hypothetical protein [Microvirga makkahensis]